MLKSLTINGYRGFATPQTITFAQPRPGCPGSGLTILVGPNNSGKSSVIESLRRFAAGDGAFAEGRRNKAAGDRVHLELVLSDGTTHTLQSAAHGGSGTLRSPSNPAEFPKLFAVPPRRYFAPYFGESNLQRSDYGLYSARDERSRDLSSFAARLFAINHHREEFDAVLSRVLVPLPRWQLELADHDQYYIKFERNGLHHNSDGSGDGLLSLFVLIDALYDSSVGEAILVDEPELSLHPSVQRRLADVLVGYSETRQIVVSTHSPYFLPFESVAGVAAIARLYWSTTKGSCIAQLSSATAGYAAARFRDLNNPHVFGLDAREAFFLDDGIILVEGQEDVVFYRRMAEQLGVAFDGAFFGWGVGGAEKMDIVASLLRELGYERVVGILDGNKETRRATLEEQFPGYRFVCLPADDIRSKRERPQKAAVSGLLEHDGTLRDDKAALAREFIQRVNCALRAAD